MKTKLAILVAVTALATAGCAADSKGTGDAPVDVNVVDDSAPKAILNFPDQFANVALKCLGKNGVYSHTREAAPVIVPNDPNCAEGA